MTGGTGVDLKFGRCIWEAFTVGMVYECMDLNMLRALRYGFELNGDAIPKWIVKYHISKA